MNDSSPRLPQMLGAEFIGTFALIFFGPGAGVVNAQTQALGHWGVAIVFGLIVAGVVTTLGPISGAHINPVATLALWVSRRFPSRLVLPYMLAQLAGASAAGFTLLALFGTEGKLGVTVPRGSDTQAFALEAILTFWLILVALRSSGLGLNGLGAGMLVGSVVMCEAMMGGPITGASMNPARSFGPAVASGIWISHWLYWIAPTLGSLLAVAANTLLESNQNTFVYSDQH
jgi:MIP family channel proteins